MSLPTEILNIKEEVNNDVITEHGVLNDLEMRKKLESLDGELASSSNMDSETSFVGKSTTSECTKLSSEAPLAFAAKILNIKEEVDDDVLTEQGINNECEASSSDSQKNSTAKSTTSDLQTFEFETVKDVEKNADLKIQGFSCEICGIKFKFPFSFKVHMRAHGKPFFCTQCGKSFRQSSQLVVHKRIHSGQKPYCCDICGKGFQLSGTMKIHKNIHTGVKPYCCSVCQKSFTYPNSLKAHVKVHTDEKPFNCDICEKSYKSLTVLKRHKRIHTEEKRYFCMKCGKCFSELSDKQAHLKTHT